MRYTGNSSEPEEKYFFFQDSVFRTLVIRYTANVISDVDSDTSHLSLARLKNGGSIGIPGQRAVVTRKYPSEGGGGEEIRM